MKVKMILPALTAAKSAGPASTAARQAAAFSELKKGLMQHYWFRKFGWMYIPISIAGSLLTIAAILLAGVCIWIADRQCTAVSDALLHFFIYFTCIAFWWKWLAESTADKTTEK